MDAFTVFASGSQCYRCVVCREEKARVALHLARGGPYGLCSSMECIQAANRDGCLSALGVDVRNPTISCAWIGVVHAAWNRMVNNPPPPDTPMRHVYAGSMPADPPGPHHVNLGLGKKR